MLSIGALLAAERERRGIPVEKAAKETRMRPQRIRDMEGDDLSHFTNPSYARMFIIAYAKYLGISMQTIGDHLPDRGEPGTEGYQYISTSTEDLPSLRNDIASKPVRRNGPLVTLLVITLVVVVVGLGGLATYLTVNANRITAVVEKPPAPEPTPTPAPIVVYQFKKEYTPTNLQADGTVVSAFEEETTLQAPPSPAPLSVQKPAPALSTAAVPSAPTPAAKPTGATEVPDDQAFLLGASPDYKPANVR